MIESMVEVKWVWRIASAWCDPKRNHWVSHGGVSTEFAATCKHPSMRSARWCGTFFMGISEAVSRFSYHFSVLFKSKHIRWNLIFIFRSNSALQSLRIFGLALNLLKWHCSNDVVWFNLVKMTHFHHFFQTIDSVLEYDCPWIWFSVPQVL